MGPSALWLFAHRALSRQFHEDPTRFVATLDSAGAPRFLEQLWTSALGAAKATAPAQPPLTYGIDRPRVGLVIIWMELTGVTQTGEPHQLRFVVREADASGAAYARMFLLEHSEYASELAGAPTAIVCESERDGKHRNWGTTTSPNDAEAFDKAMVAAIRAPATPVAETT